LFEKETWESEHQCHQQFHLTFQNGTNKCWWLFMKKYINHIRQTLHNFALQIKTENCV
jgi:hypothetical protein